MRELRLVVVPSSALKIGKFYVRADGKRLDNVEVGSDQTIVVPDNTAFLQITGLNGRTNKVQTRALAPNDILTLHYDGSRANLAIALLIPFLFLNQSQNLSWIVVGTAMFLPLYIFSLFRFCFRLEVVRSK